MSLNTILKIEAPWSNGLKGAVVKWLERLDYGAQSRREFEAGLRHATTGNSVYPAVNGYLFRIREG